MIARFRRRALGAVAGISGIWLAALAGAGSPAAANIVGEMRIIGDGALTRFVVDLEKTPDFGLMRLSNPYRLVIDLPEVAFDVPPKPVEGRGLITDYRYGVIAPGKARIVLDLTGPVQVVKSFALDPVDPQPARFVVEIAPTTAAEYEQAALSAAPPATSPEPDVRGAITDPEKPVVVIDAGHGGIDSGAIGDNILEKEITLKFARELARQLEAGGTLQAILTREDDRFLALRERMEIARRHQASLFISVHADTVREKYVRGATVYTLSDEASDAVSQALAERENRSDLLAGLAIADQPDDVADILFELARRETRNLSVRFAKSLVEDMRPTVALNANPWRRASFVVLKAPEVPSVLLELGYLSNDDDEMLFKSKDWPANEATAVARAIEEFMLESPVARQQ